MYDIVGICTPCMDLNVNVKNFPVRGRMENANQISWQGGNKVSSGLVASARLGARCAIIGHVGDDVFGRFNLKDFNRHGIDTRAMTAAPSAATSLSIVLSDAATGERTFVFHGGTVPRYTFSEAHVPLLASAKYLFIAQANAETEKAAGLAREAGAQIFVDADGYTDAMAAMIPKIDVFVASSYFYKAMFGEVETDAQHEKNCREVMAMGPKIAVFTLGDKGCVGVGKDGFFKLPAFKVDVVDTVGAGDVFHGAFLSGLLRGLSAKETARFAGAVSAIKCTRIGGRAGIPDLKTVSRFLDDGFIDYTEIDERVAYYERGLDNI
jgi:sugar/nucleoside kinase (ribokinase family)